MTDYLARFQAHTRRKADADLIRRWEWDARFNGDKHIKAQAANAKRTATSMQRAADAFSNLKPEQELAIKAAASALRAIAAEMTILAAWAKDYHAFCADQWKQEEAVALEAIAFKRWGDDAQALQFECDLMNELSTADGRHAFASWCHSVGKHQDCKLEEISCNVTRLKHGPNMRISAALTVQEGSERHATNKWDGIRGMTVICGWPDYVAYLEYRKCVANTSAQIVKMVASNRP